MKHTVDFLAKIRRLVGDDSRIRWRQMHTPTISSGPYFKDPTGKRRKSRRRFTAVKIKVLNNAAAYACEIASEVEYERRKSVQEASVAQKATGSRWAKWRTGKERESEDGDRVTENGRITVWPIGDLVAPWSAAQLLRDDIHPTQTTGMIVWGAGVLEYLARTPKLGQLG